MTHQAATLKLILDIPANGGVTETALQNRALIAGIYERMAAGNASALIDSLDPDVRFYQASSLPFGGEARGIDATIKCVEAMLSYWREVECRFQEYLVAGDWVIALVHMRAVTPAGEIFEGPVTELFRLKASRIVEWRPIWWDTHQVRMLSRAPNLDKHPESQVHP